MKKFEYIITQPAGIHAIPAGLLVKEISVYKSLITIERNGQKADGKRLMSIMALGVSCREKLTFIIEGTDEDMAAIKLEAFCRKNL